MCGMPLLSKGGRDEQVFCAQRADPGVRLAARVGGLPTRVTTVAYSHPGFSTAHTHSPCDDDVDCTHTNCPASRKRSYPANVDAVPNVHTPPYTDEAVGANRYSITHQGAGFQRIWHNLDQLA